MRTNICFAQGVIDSLKLYPSGTEIIRQLELVLEKTPLIGFECLKNLPSIRGLNYLPEQRPGSSYIPTLGFRYVFLPLADFIAGRDEDEILVFDVGEPLPNVASELSAWEANEVVREIVGIYQMVESNG